VAQDLADYDWVFDGGDDFGFSAAISTDFDVDVEYAF
jgi:hypothetical protein